jgi:hypothetical protein
MYPLRITYVEHIHRDLHEMLQVSHLCASEQVCQHPDANVYAGRVSNAEIGMSNMINWAVGLYPCNLPDNSRASARRVPFCDMPTDRPIIHNAMSTLGRI